MWFGSAHNPFDTLSHSLSFPISESTRTKPLQALHLVDTNHTTIQVEQHISSAIHVTSCHHVKITATCQQARLHTSSDLTCHFDVVTAGAILEDCVRIIFVTTDNAAAAATTTTLLEVKDFNWLRTGIPSPNFRIIQPETDARQQIASQRTEKPPITPTTLQDAASDKLSMGSKETLTSSATASTGHVLFESIPFSKGQIVESDQVPGNPEGEHNDDDEL